MRAIGKGSLSSILAVVLSVIWYMLAALLGLSVLLLLVSPWVESAKLDLDFKIPLSFTLDPQTHRVAAPSLGVADARLEDIGGSLKFVARSNALAATSAVVLIFVLGVSLWVVGQLRAVFRTLVRGRPFVAANAQRLRHIGWAVIIGELARAVFTFFLGQYAQTHFSTEGLRVASRVDLDVVVILYGMVIFVIAEVFRAGARLDEEQALTI